MNIQRHLNLAEWELEYRQRNTQSVLWCDLWGKAMYDTFVIELGLDVTPPDYIYTDSSRAYVKIKHKKTIMAQVQHACHNDIFLQRVHDQTWKRIREMENIVAKIKSSNNILDSWQQFCVAMRNLIPWFHIPWYITEENILSDRVQTLLKEHKTEVEQITDMQNALLVLLFPDREAAFQKEQRALYKLVLIGVQGKGFESAAKKYLKNFDWMTTYLILALKPLTFEELDNRVRNAQKNGFSTQYELQDQQRKKNIKLSKRILKIIAKDKQLMQAVGWARTYGWLLTASIEESIRITAQLIPFYQKVARMLGVTYEEFTLFTADEIAESLAGKSLPKNWNERKKGFIDLWEQGEKYLYVGDEGKKLSVWVDTGIGKNEQHIATLKGRGVSQGIVIGKVHIAATPKEAANIKMGEILVCSMTSPEYVPAMNRAAAIVTDEGGLLSHAAIMSRELGKPCIVGTKNATAVLRNGEEIQVDATKGVITRL